MSRSKYPGDWGKFWGRALEKSRLKSEVQGPKRKRTFSLTAKDAKKTLEGHGAACPCSAGRQRRSDLSGLNSGRLASRPYNSGGETGAGAGCRGSDKGFFVDRG